MSQDIFSRHLGVIYFANSQEGATNQLCQTLLFGHSGNNWEFTTGFRNGEVTGNLSKVDLVL